METDAAAVVDVLKVDVPACLRGEKGWDVLLSDVLKAIARYEAAKSGAKSAGLATWSVPPVILVLLKAEWDKVYPVLVADALAIWTGAKTWDDVLKDVLAAL